MANSNSGMAGFGAVGQFAVGQADEGAVTPPSSTPPTFDYPNPGRPRQPLEVFGFAKGLNLNLLGADMFFGAGGPTYDYPNPRGYIPAVQLKTWVLPLNLNLLSQDKFYGLGGPSYDYPNPRGKARSIDNWSWIGPTNPLTAIPPHFNLAGQPNYDQPNPRAQRRAIDLWSWVQPTNIVNQKILIPYTPNYDWPNPSRGPLKPIDIWTWINQGNIQLGRVIGRPTLAFSSEMATVLCLASDSPSGQNWRGSGYMAKYEIDTSIQIEGVFMDALSNVYIDPSEVILFVMDPTGAVIEYTTLNNAVIRDSLGHYHFTFVPNISGTWVYKWQGTGTAVATSPDTTFTVGASSLIAG